MRGTSPCTPSCTDCLQGKTHKLPFTTNNTDKARRVMERIHSDVSGPISTASRATQSKWFATFIAGYSGWPELGFLRHKSETFNSFKKYLIRMKPSQMRRRIISVNGNVVSEDFHRLCDNKGATITIIRSTSGWIFGGFTSASWTSS